MKKGGKNKSVAFIILFSVLWLAKFTWGLIHNHCIHTNQDLKEQVYAKVVTYKNKYGSNQQYS